jgi:hypothetical protein
MGHRCEKEKYYVILLVVCFNQINCLGVKTIEANTSNGTISFLLNIRVEEH